ncbi:MAG: hypothetical protein JNL30_10240 [Rubrivivax sp.]|nr:hypothetical protein [Rubrivivax sp.]
MNKRELFAAALAAGFGAIAATARAEGPDDISFSGMWDICDSNKDGTVNRAEFVAAMGKAYDAHMKKMKSKPDAAKMMKGDALTADGLRALFRATYPGP